MQLDESERKQFGFKQIAAADHYSAAVLKDGSIYTWGMNDRGQMGVGSGNGLDMVESESIPKQLDFSSSFPQGATSNEPVIIDQVQCGQNTMIMRDHLNRIFKTGLKIDYSPKLVRFDSELLPA